MSLVKTNIIYFFGYINVTVQLTMKVAGTSHMYSPITLHRVTWYVEQDEHARGAHCRATRAYSVCSTRVELYKSHTMELASIAFNNIHEFTERFDLFLIFISLVNHCDFTPEFFLHLDTPFFQESTFFL